MNRNNGIAISTSFDITPYVRCTNRSSTRGHRGRRVDAAIGEPAEDHAHAHQRERRGKAEHDAHDDHREHQQSQMAVGHLRRRRHQHEHQRSRHGHERKPEPDFLSHLRASACPCDHELVELRDVLVLDVHHLLSACRRPLPRRPASRDGQSPCFKQMMQRMISTMPCIRINAPATGITVLNG